MAVVKEIIDFISDRIHMRSLFFLLKTSKNRVEIRIYYINWTIFSNLHHEFLLILQ